MSMTPEAFNKIQIEEGNLTEEMIDFLMDEEAMPAAIVAQAKKFQLDNKLQKDGKIGTSTRDVIEAELKSYDYEPPGKLLDEPEDGVSTVGPFEIEKLLDIESGPIREAVALTPEQVQEGLATLGYYDGDKNGDLTDDEFQDDLRDFQRDTHIGRDGWYGTESEGKLKPLLITLDANKPAGLTRLHRFQVTSYYAAQEVNYRAVDFVPVHTSKGKLLANVPARFFAQMAMEGTGILNNGMILNVSGTASKCDPEVFEPVFQFAKRNNWIPKLPGYAGIRSDGTKATGAFNFHEVALGQRGFPLEAKDIESSPFKTLAADNGRHRRHHPSFRGKGGLVPAGTKVFILEFVGMKYPTINFDGEKVWETHDGWLTVNDTGAAIKGSHFDLFTGYRSFAKEVRRPHRCHVWWEGMEDRLDINDHYGLFD